MRKEGMEGVSRALRDHTVGKLFLDLLHVRMIVIEFFTGDVSPEKRNSRIRDEKITESIKISVMIQPFSSVYVKDYREHDREPELEIARECLYYKDLGENFLPAEDSKAIYNAERDESVIKDMHLKRLISTYQFTYCASVGKKSLVIDPNNLDADEFLVHFNNYYAKRTQAVPRPLDTGRRIFGYSRFSYYYTGRSTYEDLISKEGYEYFKRDYDKGLSRLFRKKQMAARRQNQDSDAPQKEGERKEDGEKRSEPLGQVEVREKICAVCCEKFGAAGDAKERGSEN